jgi:hypothetical protein
MIIDEINFEDGTQGSEREIRLSDKAYDLRNAKEVWQSERIIASVSWITLDSATGCRDRSLTEKETSADKKALVDSRNQLEG